MTKRRILTAVAAVALCLTVGVSTAFAATAGYSDYGKSEEKDVVAGQTVELTSPKTGISFDIPSAALPEGVTKVAVETTQLKADSDEVKAVVKAAADKGFDKVTVFELNLLDQDGKNISKLNGKVSVTIPVVDGANTVLYIADDGAITNLGGTVKNGFITFETDHFSTYALAKTTTVTPGGDTPGTGGNSGMTTVAIIFVMSAVVLTVGVASMKMKKASKKAE